jgi:hypothetical protein
MKHIVNAFYGALLVLGLAGIVPNMAARARRKPLGCGLQLPPRRL